MRGLGFLTAATLIGFAYVPTAGAAATITQNRDEPGRNPYQQTVTAPCGGKLSCTMTFPKIAANERAVIEFISCELGTKNENSGVLIRLYGSTAPKTFAPFFAEPWGNQTFAEFRFNAQTLFYAAGGASPIVSIVSAVAFDGAQSCFLSGYTVTLP